jgi:hypothetical protein
MLPGKVLATFNTSGSAEEPPAARAKKSAAVEAATELLNMDASVRGAQARVSLGHH